MTRRQRQVLELLEREPLANSRRVAGELGWRSQDAGRVLRALERAGLARFEITPTRAGWRAQEDHR
jgi:DNA-binding MarR family transcriptional regulator